MVLARIELPPRAGVTGALICPVQPWRALLGFSLAATTTAGERSPQLVRNPPRHGGPRPLARGTHQGYQRGGTPLQTASGCCHHSRAPAGGSVVVGVQAATPHLCPPVTATLTSRRTRLTGGPPAWGRR